MGRKQASPLTSMAGTMTDGVEFMRKMWSLSGLPQVPTLATPGGIAQFTQGLPQALPSMITPTLDIGELDQRIADLRAVEQWLNLNASMLRTSIQTLEVQRNTIATLKSFGGSVLASLNPGREATAVPRNAGGQAEAARPEAVWPPQRKRRPTATTAATDLPPAGAAAPAADKAAAPRPTAPAAGALAAGAAAWWDALQDQFARVAAVAAAPAGSGSRSSAKPAPARAPKRRKKRANPKPG